MKYKCTNCDLEEKVEWQIKTIALRFSDNYAPLEGTIKLHQDVIYKFGYAWYGKFENSLSQKNIDMLFKMEEKKFLLIKSGCQERYWVYFEDIRKENININAVPSYYRNDIKRIKCWFRILEFEKVDSKVMSKCFVISNGALLSNTSKYSMSPYFVIDCKEDFNE